MHNSFLLLFIVWFSCIFLKVESYTYEHFTDGYFTVVHVVTVDPKEHLIRPVRANEVELAKRETVAVMVKSHGALVGINGGFYKADGTPSGILKIDGQWHGTPVRPRGAIGWSTSKITPVLIDRVLTNYALLQCPQGCEIEVIPQSDPPCTTAQEWAEVEHIVGGTPILVARGNLIEDFAPEKTLQSFIGKRFARTAVGIKATGEWVFVVVDTSFYGSVGGMTMKELAQLMLDLGCIDALNLCGGRSSTLVIEGIEANNAYGQAVSDAILILK